MRRRASIAAILSVAFCFLAFSPHARADQNDARLAQLFTQLRATKDKAEAARLTRTIWAVWFEARNPAVRELVLRGQTHLRLRRIAVAAELFNHIVKIAPDYAEGWNRRATVRYLLGNYQGSLRDINRTLKLEPRHFGALSGRGLVLIKLGRHRAAIAAFKAALAINPHLDSARLNIRALRKKLGEKAI